MEQETKIQMPHEDVSDRTHVSACESMPDFTRLRYFHGQLLGHHDFQNEQDYFREKLKLLNRCLQGYGTVCGLKVVAVTDDPDCKPLDYDAEHHEHEKQETYDENKESVAQSYENEARRRKPLCVEIECGLALDCEGNELVVRHPLRVDLWQALSEAEGHQINGAGLDAKVRFYLSICYCVQPIDPVRPVLPDACSAVSECIYSRLRDSVKIKVTTQKPKLDHCRDNCCDKCSDKCLLLATIDFEKGLKPIIHNDVRRWITVHEPVTITGINWYHGAAYSINEARKLLRTDGLQLYFSRDVLTETITDGVVDAWVMEGGSGRSGNIYNLALKLDVAANNGVVPQTTRLLKFHRISGEHLQDGDRVLLIVRTDFILDECCRPVDGNHAGGRVPYFGEDRPRPRLRNRAEVNQVKCLTPPRRYGPWVSGNNSAGGTFESWFFIKDPDSDYEEAATAE
jgi:hypothetical protein